MIGTVIVTYNGAAWIRRNLESLRASTRPTHVIVVDNGSIDGTPDIVERDHPEVELIRMRRNAGFGVGNNAGIAQALRRGLEYVLLLNQDAYVTDAAVAQLADFLDAHREFGVVSPLHCSPTLQTVDPKTLAHYLAPNACAYLSDACTGRVQPHYRIRGINAAAWFVRCSVFEQTGGFDPLFFMYGEDDDLICRFAFHRIGFGLFPSSSVVHLRESVKTAAPTRRQRIERLALRARSALLVEIKQPEFSRRHMAARLVANGLLEPLSAFVIERDVDTLLASVLAATRLVRELSAVRRHAAICATRGPHFL